MFYVQLRALNTGHNNWQITWWDDIEFFYFRNAWKPVNKISEKQQ